MREGTVGMLASLIREKSLPVGWPALTQKRTSHVQYTRLSPVGTPNAGKNSASFELAPDLLSPPQQGSQAVSHGSSRTVCPQFVLHVKLPVSPQKKSPSSIYQTSHLLLILVGIFGDFPCVAH